jgi:hypothetical protein
MGFLSLVATAVGALHTYVYDLNANRPTGRCSLPSCPYDEASLATQNINARDNYCDDGANAGVKEFGDMVLEKVGVGHLVQRSWGPLVRIAALVCSSWWHSSGVVSGVLRNDMVEACMGFSRCTLARLYRRLLVQQRLETFQGSGLFQNYELFCDTAHIEYETRAFHALVPSFRTLNMYSKQVPLYMLR